MKSLNMELQISRYSITGNPEKEPFKVLLQNITNFLGMDRCGMKPAIFTRPINTIQHNSDSTEFYLIICSCHCFSTSAVKAYIEHLDHKVFNTKEIILSLEDKY